MVIIKIKIYEITFIINYVYIITKIKPQNKNTKHFSRTLLSVNPKKKWNEKQTETKYK